VFRKQTVTRCRCPQQNMCVFSNMQKSRRNSSRAREYCSTTSILWLKLFPTSDCNNATESWSKVYHPTKYIIGDIRDRFWVGFLWVECPGQQCQSTKGR